MQKKETLISGNFPKRLKEMRHAKEWSQGQLAQKIGIEANRISKYERGAMLPTLELAVRLAKNLGVSLDYLVRDEENSAINKISNPELLKRIEHIETLPKEDQDALILVLEAFIKKQKLYELVHP